MAIMERWVHQLKDHDAWDEIMVQEKQWVEIEQGLGGFPSKRHYQPLAGSEDSLKFIWEREWDSMSTMEQHYEKLATDESAAELGTKTKELVVSIRRELFSVRTLSSSKNT